MRCFAGGGRVIISPTKPCFQRLHISSLRPTLPPHLVVGTAGPSVFLFLSFSLSLSLGGRGGGRVGGGHHGHHGHRGGGRGQPHHSCPSLAQVPQLGFDPSHRSFRFLQTTQAIRFGRGTSTPSLFVVVPDALEELPMLMPGRPNSWLTPKSKSDGRAD